jgi:hypothetical protein
MINKYIDHSKLNKIHYNENLEPIQILLKILTKKRIKKSLKQNFKLISKIEKDIISFQKIITKVKSVNLISKKDYNNSLKDTSCQVFKIEYDNGDIFYFKNTKRILISDSPERLDINSHIKNSQLRPPSLSLNDCYSKKQLYTLLKLKLNKITDNSNIKQILLMILKSSKDNQSDILHIQGLKEKLSLISLEDEKSIFRDFGEIIGALNVCSEDQKIRFSEQNEKLIDFIIDGEQENLYSCKFSSSDRKTSGGSLSSIAFIVDYLEKIKDNLNEEEKNFYQLLSTIRYNRGSLEASIKTAQFLGIEQECEKEFLSYPKKDQVKGRKVCIFWRKIKKKINSSHYKNILNKILNNINIKQIYLIYDKNDTIIFKIKSFKENSFSFDTNVSINKYKFKLGFKMD